MTVKVSGLTEIDASIENELTKSTSLNSSNSKRNLTAFRNSSDDSSSLIFSDTESTSETDSNGDSWTSRLFNRDSASRGTIRDSSKRKNIFKSINFPTSDDSKITTPKVDVFDLRKSLETARCTSAKFTQIKITDNDITEGIKNVFSTEVYSQLEEAKKLMFDQLPTLQKVWCITRYKGKTDTPFQGKTVSVEIENKPGSHYYKTHIHDKRFDVSSVRNLTYRANSIAIRMPNVGCHHVENPYFINTICKRDGVGGYASIRYNSNKEGYVIFTRLAKYYILMSKRNSSSITFAKREGSKLNWTSYTPGSRQYFQMSFGTDKQLVATSYRSRNEHLSIYMQLVLKTLQTPDSQLQEINLSQLNNYNRQYIHPTLDPTYGLDHVLRGEVISGEFNLRRESRGASDFNPNFTMTNRRSDSSIKFIKSYSIPNYRACDDCISSKTKSRPTQGALRISRPIFSTTIDIKSHGLFNWLASYQSSPDDEFRFDIDIFGDKSKEHDDPFRRLSLLVSPEITDFQYSASAMPFTTSLAHLVSSSDSTTSLFEAILNPSILMFLISISMLLSVRPIKSYRSRSN